MYHFHRPVVHRRTLAAAVCGALIASLAAAGCFSFVGEDCGAPALTAPSEPLSPIALALRYLEATQLATDQFVVGARDYAGSWPQCVAAGPNGPYVREVSPFMATFVHHALTRITEQNREILGLTDGDVEAARRMRTAAVDMMLRFQAPPDAPDAGTFGFWPEGLPPRLLLSLLVDGTAPGPFWYGPRAPLNFPVFPLHLMLASDADDTACVYATLLDHATLDGGLPVGAAFEQFFADWRDLGQVPRRNDAPWLPSDSGAYLTWLAYRDDPADPGPNDVDPVVNANVLYALGRYGRLDTPGVAEAVAIIKEAARIGLHPADPFELSLYYPDSHALHYCVARAWREGGVADLAPAVELLADDLLGSVRLDEAGRYYWDRGDPHLDTALAALTLLAAADFGDYSDIVAGAIDYLIAEQDPDTGAWRPGAFFGGRLDDGSEGAWVSSALTTAMALEALAGYELAMQGD